MMISAPIGDVTLKRLLTRARRALLDLAESPESKDASGIVAAAVFPAWAALTWSR